MRSRAAVRAHFIQSDSGTGFGSLVSGFATGQTAAKDVNRDQLLF